MRILKIKLENRKNKNMPKPDARESGVVKKPDRLGQLDHGHREGATYSQNIEHVFQSFVSI